MSFKAVPARLEPRFVTRLWGARQLGRLYPQARELATPVGEVWLTGEDCRMAAGQFAGHLLGDAWLNMPQEWKGARTDAAFPLLVKFLFPNDVLSVQVHPDDAYAARHEASLGGRGKTEMWHAVEARPGAEVLAGLKAGASRESLGAAIAAGTIEDLIERIPVSAGDTIFVPAGTIHTIMPGLVLCEVQEHSDLTYRLYDYKRIGGDGKPRELQIEKALDVIRYGPSPAGKTRPLARRYGPLAVKYLVACRYFAAERWESTEPFETTTSADHFDLLVFLAGEGRLVVGDHRLDYGSGQLWFLPATLGRYRLEPDAGTTLLRTYVPDLDAFEQRMLAEGVSPEELAGILFR